MNLRTLSFLIAYVTSLAAAEDSLTVDAAIERVLRTHPALESAQASIEAAAAEAGSARSLLSPDVSGTVQYTRIGPLPAFSIPNLGDIVLAPGDNYDAHLGGSYTVYDFGRTTAAVDLAQSRVASIRESRALTRTSLALQTARTLYTIIFLQRSIVVQEEQIAALRQHLAITQKRVAAGSATNFDVLTIQVRVAAAENQEVDVRNALVRQQSVARQLLGLAAETPVTVSGSFDEDHFLPNLDSLLRVANASRAEVDLARASEQSATLQEKVSSLGNMPIVRVFANYGVKNGYEPNLDAWRGNWAIGAAAAIPLFNGHRTSFQVDEAKALVEAEHARTRGVLRQIQSEVEQACADVEATEHKVAISRVQLEQSHEAVAIARAQYEIGTITNLDLLDAETAESAAKLTHLQAFYQYTLSRFSLRQATGTLVRPE
jgi:outer membrane protein TolC